MSFTLSVLFSTILGFMLMLGSPQAAHAAITDCTNMVSPNEYALNLIQDTCMINHDVPYEDQISDEFLFIQPVYDTGNANFRIVSNTGDLFYHVSSASGSGTVGGSTWVVTLDCNAGCTVSPVSGASFVPFTYTFSGTTGGMSGGAAPELDIRNSADNADIGDGSTTITTALGTDFGTVTVGSSATNSFRAENNGTSALTFGADALAISNTTDFQITADLTNSGTVASSGVNAFSIRFNPATGGTKTATVTIRSDDDDEDPYTFSIRGTGNNLPQAHAGGNTVVASEDDVMLDSAGSVANDAGQTLTYAWAQTAGPAVALDDDESATPSFTAPTLAIGDADVTLIFVLTVDDGFATATDSVTITVTAPLDTQAPVVAGIGDIAVDTDAGVNTASVVLTATITDNSGETILPIFSIDGTVITSPFDFPVGATTVVVDAQDSAGNAAVQQSFVVSVTDTTPPEEPVVVTLIATSDSQVNLSGTVEPGSTVTVTFPDGSTQTVTADVITGAFTVTSDTPQQSGVVTIIATDVAMNDSDPTEVDFIGDDTSPTVSIGALSGPTDGTYTAVITLSEDSSDFDASDLTLDNATATLSGGGSSYTATVTPSSDGAVTLSVAAGTFTDPAGNSNDASNTVSAVYDGTAPTVSISGAPDALEGDGAFTLNITFSEAVTGFVAADISSTNAIVTGVSGSDASYVANLRASGTGDVQVSVPANVAADAAGNGNLASNLVVISDFTIERTQELIASYMQTRANQLLLNQPDLMSFLSGSPRGEFYFVATPETGNLDFASNANSPVWAQASASWTNNGDSRSEYVFGALGAHRSVNENLLVGAMLQFDHLNEDTGSASIGGTGWMVGPYFVARSAVQPLYFEGRLLYGESDNDVSPFGTYEDSVDTTRLLAQLKVAGELAYGATTLSPFVDASYTTDDQDSYIDSLGNPIPEQGITLGQIEVGMDFSVMMPVNTEELELWGGVSGIWSHTSGSGYASTVTPDYEGGRARVELGINHQISIDQSFTAGTYYDGIGAGDYESYGLSLGYQMQF